MSVNSKRLTVFIILTVIIVLFIFLFFFPYQSGPSLLSGTRKTIGNGSASTYVQTQVGLFSSENNQLQTLNIDLATGDYLKISKKREYYLSIPGGRIFSADNKKEYVPAVLTYGEKKVNAKLRLKGDASDHIEYLNKWSFRIKIKSNESLFGMKVFSLQRPETRNFLNEYFFHRMLKHLGLIFLRYDFLNVALNGENLGLYAIEEHFSKNCIENNRQREGVIIRLNETLRWAHTFRNSVDGVTTLDAIGKTEYYETFYAAPFTSKKIIKNEQLFEQFSAASTLLEKFRRGELTTCETFDAKKLATYFALMALMAERHASHPDNIRFYYNPMTSLLEPVGYDQQKINNHKDREGEPLDSFFKHVNTNTQKHYETNEYSWFSTIFEDPNFFRLYIQELEEISRQSFLDDFFTLVDDELQEKIDIIRTAYPFYDFKEPRVALYANQKYIRHILDPIKGVQVFLKGYDLKKQEVTLQIYSIIQFPVEIHSLKLFKKEYYPKEGIPIIQPYMPQQPPMVTEIAFDVPIDKNFGREYVNNMQVQYTILGGSAEKSIEVFAWPYLDYVFEENDVMRKKTTLSDNDYDFLIVDEVQKIVTFREGDWTMENDLIIPAGYTVCASAGVYINQINNAVLISRSPIRFEGTKDDAIVITSSDGTGQGICILNTQDKSELRYVTFNNLKAPHKGYWRLTGAVTFYESPVILKSCSFENMNSEDAINLVRVSDAVLDSCIFKNCISDAIDCDYSTVTIERTKVSECAGDAFDFCGTQGVIQDCYIDEAGDKGISVGEKSFIEVHSTMISHAKIGIASKDLSHVSADAVEFSRCNIGLALYKKKSEYGPAEIEAKNCSFYSNYNDYLVEPGSRLHLDGELIEGQQ